MTLDEQPRRVMSGVNRTPDTARRVPARPESRDEDGFPVEPAPDLTGDKTPRPPRASTTTSTKTRPQWMTHKPTLAVAGLVVVVVELLAYQVLGLDGWLLVNCLLGAVAVAVVLLRKRAAGTRGSGHARTGSLGGLLGRLRGRSPSSGASGAGRGGLGARRSPLGLGTGRTGTSGGPSGAPAPRGGRLAGAWANRPSWLGGKRAGTGSPRGTGPKPRGAATSGARSSGSRTGLGARVAAARGHLPRWVGGTRTKTNPAKPSQTTSGAPGGGRGGWWDRFKNGYRTGSKISAPKAPAKPATTRTAPSTPAPVTAPAPGRPPQPVPQPVAVRHGKPGRTSTMGIQHSDDASLQAWGRGLKTIAPALQEVDKRHKDAAASTAAAAAAVTKIANQAQSDLPVSKSLAAEADSLASGLRALQADEEALAARRAALIGRAEALPGAYGREHETDEDRLHAPRNSRAAEKRADVGAAEQDT